MPGGAPSALYASKTYSGVRHSWGCTTRGGLDPAERGTWTKPRFRRHGESPRLTSAAIVVRMLMLRSASRFDTSVIWCVMTARHVMKGSAVMRRTICTHTTRDSLLRRFAFVSGAKMTISSRRFRNLQRAVDERADGEQPDSCHLPPQCLLWKKMRLDCTHHAGFCLRAEGR